MRRLDYLSLGLSEEEKTSVCLSVHLRDFSTYI